MVVGASKNVYIPLSSNIGQNQLQFLLKSSGVGSGFLWEYNRTVLTYFLDNIEKPNIKGFTNSSIGISIGRDDELRSWRLQLKGRRIVSLEVLIFHILVLTVVIVLVVVIQLGERRQQCGGGGGGGGKYQWEQGSGYEAVGFIHNSIKRIRRKKRRSII